MKTPRVRKEALIEPRDSSPPAASAAGASKLNDFAWIYALYELGQTAATASSR